MSNRLVTEIVEEYKPIWALDHALALMDWDVETHMPSLGASSRGFSQAQLLLLKQKKFLQISPSVAKAEQLRGLTDRERGILRLIKRDANYFLKVPAKLVEDLQRTITEATIVWREARKKSEYRLFKPHLEKIITLKREEAECLGYEKHPYDAHLNLFEEELTCDDIDAVFSPLVSDLRTILGKIQSSGSFADHHELESIRYQEDAMTRVNVEAVQLLGMPKDTFRLDVSTHPFTSGIAIKDVRITTRYEGENFRESLFSLIHECGHALYDLQIDSSIEYTPLARGTSLGVHESQSRFWENFIGRSRGFVALVYPNLKKNLEFVSRFSEEEVYKYFNVVRPTPIRVAADEITYNSHIALRYEIEKRLLKGDVDVSDVPSVWNELTRKYVGVTPEDDAAGVLQDIHWSNGSFGYFPTYALGNVIAAMFFDKLRKEVDLISTVAKGDFEKLKDWLREHVHRHGATYSPKELQRRIVGDEYNPRPLLDYLENKYLG